MKTARSDTYIRTEKESKTSISILFLFIILIYAGIRIIAWSNNHIFLEDHDSVAFLWDMRELRTFDFKAIVDLPADANPFYRFFGALCSLPGWSVEFGARLCSFLFSLLLLASIIGIGRQVSSSTGIAIGLLILSFSPEFIRLSFSILTEPSFIATVYFGIWLFLARHKNLRLWQGSLLGLIFGLAFLNRLEGILFLGMIPLFQLIHLISNKERDYTFKAFIGWCLIFVISFSLVAAPQILRVSHKMGRFSFNGREVWSLLLNQPDGRSKTEKIYGLNYSKGQTNLEYFQSNPEALKELKSEIPFKEYLLRIGRNFNQLYRTQSGVLIGPLGFIFFAFGLACLYQRGYRYEIILLLTFIGFILVPPLMHNVVIRHIAIIAPFIFLIEGIGIVYLSEKLLKSEPGSSAKINAIAIAFLVILFGASFAPFYKAIAKPLHIKDFKNYKNYYKVLESYREPATIIREISENELKRIPNIVTQKIHIAYVAEGSVLPMPYTDYDSLVHYSRINNADFLVILHTSIEKFPYKNNFLTKNSAPDFLLLYEGVDSDGNKMSLYRFIEKGLNNSK